MYLLSPARQYQGLQTITERFILHRVNEWIQARVADPEDDAEVVVGLGEVYWYGQQETEEHCLVEAPADAVGDDDKD